jgi:TPP-dependent pyruvate/acetoin dehydrogenase alpha subunit
MIREKIVNFEKKLQDNMKDIYCPTHLSLGHEGVAEEIHQNIKEIDWLFSNHRNHHHYLAKGGDEKKNYGMKSWVKKLVSTEVLLDPRVLRIEK